MEISEQCYILGYTVRSSHPFNLLPSLPLSTLTNPTPGQLVAMEIPVNGEIGDEVHTVDQILLFTSGRGLATVAGKDQAVKAGDVVVVPAGTQHQFVTQGDEPLELITVYSPAEHLPSSVHRTKEEGDRAEEEGVDEAPEWAGRAKGENEKMGLVRESGKYE